METQAREFYERFQRAQTSAERDTVAAEFQTFYDGLTAAEKTQVRPVLDEILDDAERILEDVAPLIERTEQMLRTRNEAVLRSA